MEQCVNGIGGNGHKRVRPGRNGHQKIDRSSDAREDAERAVECLLRGLGEDPSREGLRETPRRVVAALKEMTQGYREDPAQVLAKVFHEPHEGLVLVQDIPFVSLCEHHLLPVTGHATLGYLPDGKVVGLSKLSRLVQVFARRLQIQERMTDQIAHALETHLEPRGVGVVVRAEHACMALRGVRTPAPMITSAFRGALEDHQEREGFFQMVVPIPDRV